MTIYSMEHGTPFEQVVWPSATRPGWAYATDETYRYPSFVPTEYAVVRGPLAQIENVDIHLDMDENRIPTDLYYASVEDPLYDLAGQRDWDANGNGVYGQNAYARSLDGVSFAPDLAVGRVPAENGEEAGRWVDRSLAYEKYDGHGSSFAERLLLIGDNWGGSGGSATYRYRYDELEAGYYHLESNGTDFGRAKVFFRGPVRNTADWVLVFSGSEGTFSIGYNRDASPTSGGYYYNTDETFSTRSETVVEILGLRLHIPLETRFVTVFAPYRRIHSGQFFFDNLSPDGVIAHKERIAGVLEIAAPAVTDVKRLYRDWYDYPGTRDPSMELTDSRATHAIEDGRNLVSLAGHGLPSGCCGLGVYDSFTLRSSGIAYVDSCLTARWTDPYGSLAERMTVGTWEGVSAYIGSSAYSWIGQGNDFEAAFWDELRRNNTLAAMHHTKARFLGNAGQLKQKAMAPAVWTVSDLKPGRSFSWETRKRGMRMVGTHQVIPIEHGTHSILSLEITGPLGLLLLPVLSLAGTYALSIENHGLKKWCEAHS